MNEALLSSDDLSTVKEGLLQLVEYEKENPGTIISLIGEVILEDSQVYCKSGILPTDLVHRNYIDLWVLCYQAQLKPELFPTPVELDILGISGEIPNVTALPVNKL